MANPVFIRLAEVINKKQDMRVVSVTVKPTITNCSGTIWFTDLQLQEGPALTGYVPHTESRLAEGSKVWFNGVVRSAETVIVCNLGETSGGLHKVTLEDGKSARVLFELQEMTDGGVSV